MELTQSQKQIIEQKGKNLLVSASAGSGKTFVVIERILNRILKDKVSVDKLLVVTFTNAAASELKERLIKKLNAKLDEAKDKEERRYILNQIRRVPLSNISTIHSFCLNVIKDNFFHLGLDPSISIMEDSISKVYILESIMEMLEECYEEKQETFIDILQLFKSESNLIEVIQNIYKYYLSMPDREEWINRVKEIYSIEIKEQIDLKSLEFGKTILDSIYEKIDILLLEFNRVLSQIEDMEDFRTRYEILLNIKNKIEKVKLFETYDEMFQYINILDVSERLPNSKVSSEELKEEVKQVKSLASKYLKDIKNIAYKDTKDMLLELNSMYDIVKYILNMILNVHEKYTLKKKEKNVIDFTDIEHIALKALQNKEIAKIYKEKFEEIYIDEYQDTSRVQETIISKIKRDNNIIMVGDVKQSIYGFRHAVPELFTEKYLSFPQEEKEDNSNLKILLDKNFRSEYIVLDTVNYIFEKAMSLKCGGIDYTKDESLKYGKEQECFGEEYITEVNIVETEQIEDIEEKDETETFLEEMTSLEKEATLVADKINSLVASKMQVIDDVTKQKRDIKYRDVVILLRSISKAGSVIEEVFKKKGIPVFSDSGEGFLKTEEINLIVSFIKILNNEFDDICLASIMYSVIGNFTLDEITEIRIENKNTHLVNSVRKYIEDGENNILKDKAQEFLNLIERYRQYLDVYSFAEVIIKFYEETGIYSSMELEENAQMKKANLDAFIEIVSNFEKKEAKSLVQLLNYIDNLNKKGGSYDSPKIMGENENVVRIMTIHKSKGLEFPVVILMNTNKKYNDIDEKQDVLTDEILGLGLNIYNKEYNIVYPSVIKQAIKQKKKDSMLSEELRLLYVALTRAKYKLLIYGSVPNYEKFEAKLNVNCEAEKLSIADVKSCNSYLKLIIKACNAHLESESPIKITVNKLETSEVAEEISKETAFTIRQCSYEEKLKENIGDTQIDKEYLEKLINIYDVKYKYSVSNEVQAKYTATELKQSKENEEIVLQDLKPQVLEKEVSQTSYGTFIHKVVENIDLLNIKEDSIQNAISLAITQMKLQDKVDIKRTNTKISKLLNGELKDILDNAKEVYKEYEFVVKDNLEGIKGLQLPEETLIQGVIDLYIVTKDNKHIIIDYKTDKMESKGELIERYKYQLLVYKRAIEKIKEVKLGNVYIYSFYLDELIKLDI